MSTVLLEIGTEELPAGFVSPALAQLADLARARLQEERITVGALHSWGTPRRLALYLTDVDEYQAPAIREARGPAVQAAFAGNGEPTQAAIGFARSQGMAVNDLRIRRIDDGEYVVALFHDEGRPLFDLLPAIFTDLISALTFPKTMRWGRGDFRFARPLRWLVAMLDSSVVSFTIDGVTSGRTTRGHRFLALGDVEIATATDYPRIMDESQVIIDQQARREAIRGQLEAVAEGATILDDGTLLDDTTFRVEYPTAVRGAIDPAFLTLPEPVLVHVLKREQDFFPLGDGQGALLPAFIGVRNGDKAYLGTVREGYESVVRAKLIDAHFFYERDRRQTPEERIETLRSVIFQERLGSMHEKAKRLEVLVGLIAAWLDFAPEDRQFAERAALLAKTDLVTAMVNEHPELQGTMGMIYARQAGEPGPVATAIGEQYQPRSATDAIPATPLGRVLALVDKLDTVAACFAIGLQPTGSEDPYALRREASGVVRIMTALNHRLALSTLVERALRQLPAEKPPREAVLKSLLAFFRQRVESVLVADGISQPVCKAVLARHADTPSRAITTARFLQGRLDDPAFFTAARVAARLHNISRQVADDGIEESLLAEDAESALYRQYREITPEAEQLTARGDLDALLALLVSLAPAIDRFFSDVLVMTDDPALRQNRLALAHALATLFHPFGDLAQLGL